jgi:hypothetical protein
MNFFYSTTMSIKTLTTALTLFFGLLLLGTAPAQAQTVTFNAESASVAAGNTVTIPVTVQGFDDITGVQFTLEWDPSVLSFNSTGNPDNVTGISGGVFGDPTENNVPPGHLTVVWDDPNATGVTLGDGTAFFTVTLTATGSAGAASDITFTGDPTEQLVASGTDVLTFASNDGSVNVTAPPEMSVTPASLDFGELEVGQSASQSVTVQSTGGADLDVSGVSLTGSGDYSQTNDCSAALPPGNDCTVTVELDPQTPGNKPGTLSIASNAGDEDVSLSGSATEPVTPTPGISVNPTSLSFGSVSTDASASQSVTVESTGDADLEVNTLNITGLDDSDFSVANNGCTGAIAPNNTCDIEVQFAPANVGPKDATLAIASNAGSQNVSLAGSGQTPPPPTSDDEVTFTVEDASVPTGGEVTVDVTVEGFADVTGIQFSLDWDESLLELTSVNAGDLPNVSGGDVPNLGGLFNMPSPGSLSFVWDDEDATGKSLPDGAVAFSLTFDAVGAGDQSADVSLIDTPTPQMVFVDFAEATFIGNDGTVDILSQVPITGAVTYYDGRPLEGALLTLDGPSTATTSTGGNGSFSFMATVAQDFQLSAEMPDDAPSNGVNVNDISLTRRHILTVTPLNSPYKMLAADVDGDAAVAVNDISGMRQFILGITPTFTGGNWTCPVEGSATTDPLAYDVEYTYMPLSVEQPGQDFFCFHMGDVDGSWSPEAGTALIAAERKASSSAGPPLRLSMAGQAAETENEVLVLLTADQFENIGGYQFTVEWDAEVLAFAGVEQFGLEDLSPKNFGTHRTEEGILTTAWTDPSGTGQSLEPGAVLFGMRFRPVKDAATTLDVSSAVTPMWAHRGDDGLAPVAVRSSPATLEASSFLPGAFTLQGNYPNPFARSTQVAFDLPEAAVLTVEVYDVLGRRVLRVPNQELTAGTGRTVSLDASQLSPGLYFYRVQAEMSSGIKTQTGQMTLVR